MSWNKGHAKLKNMIDIIRHLVIEHKQHLIPIQELNI